MALFVKRILNSSETGFSNDIDTQKNRVPKSELACHWYRTLNWLTCDKCESIPLSAAPLSEASNLDLREFKCQTYLMFELQI